MKLTHQQKKEAVRAVIVAAVPDVVVNKHAQLIHFDHTVSYFTEYRPITLEDVLRTIKEKSMNVVGLADDKYAWMESKQFKAMKMWTLGQPLDFQPSEVVDFLYDVLCEQK